MSAITKTYSVQPPEGSTTRQVEVDKLKKRCLSDVNVGVLVRLDFYCLDHEMLAPTRIFELT